jgi:hypothetical protein
LQGSEGAACYGNFHTAACRRRQSSPWLGPGAIFAGIATLSIAVIAAVATYIDNYYTASVGQWVANDLRVRIYEHLQSPGAAAMHRPVPYWSLECHII